MKNILYTACFLMMPSSFLFAQEANTAKPQKIYGIAREDKPVAYYENQSRLWQELIEKEPSYAEGWINYFRAERAKLQLEQPDLWMNDKEAFNNTLSPILIKAKKDIGNTFDYYWMKAYNTSGKTRVDALKKAHSIDPERDEIYGGLLVHYASNFNTKEAVLLGKRMLMSNIYSDANLKWNYNALVSVEKDGILITLGDIDGISKWVLQYGANIRPDVLVISKWLLATDTAYQHTIYRTIDIPLPKLQVTNFKDTSLYADYLIADLLKRAKRPAYISSGNPPSFFKNNGLEGNLHLVGIVLKYSNEAFDNTPFLIENFENNYYLEYLFKNFQHHQEDKLVKMQLNATYLPGLKQLKEYFQSKGKEAKVKHYDKLINQIVSDSLLKE